MVTTNKILTVSYGTFSCTLEGFDDSFGTMKAIAEYFRDLAADDRYFGAEPPQPDADMLARIAQKEIARRVEAHRGEAGIVLRASEAPLPATAPPEAAVSAGLAAQAEAARASARPSRAAPAGETPEAAGAETQSVAPAPQAAPPVAEDMPPRPMDESSDSIAAKLARIRAVVSRGQEAPIEGVYTEDEHSESLMRGAAPDPAAPPEAEPALAEAPAPEAAHAPEADEEEAHEAEATPSAEVGQAGAAGESVEDEPAPEETAEAWDEVEDEDTPAYAAALAEEEPIEEAGDLEEAIAPEASEAMDAGDADGFDDEDAQADGRFDDEGYDEDGFEDEDDGPLTLVGPIGAESADDTDEAEEAGDNILADADAATAAGDAPAPRRPRVLRVRRSEFDAAILRGTVEEERPEEEDTAEEAHGESGGAQALSPEAEADLMRELAEVEAEFAQAVDPGAETAAAPYDAEAEAEDEDDAPLGHRADDEVISDDGLLPDEAEVRDEDEDEAPGRSWEDTVAEAEADLRRLLAEADTKMDEPETSERLQAFSQLQGAAQAARSQDLEDDGDDSDAYRADLDKVVRPRRPEAAGSRAGRPAQPEVKPAPLKLVAAQRVDIPGGPVRPRRIAGAAPAEVGAGGDRGFAAYASTVGATDLPELLEAAAAYLSFVEGHDEFSRPQLMTQVRTAVAAEYSREDGLRFFGQLLREGKIEKISGGRFTASDRIGFRPEAKRA